MTQPRSALERLDELETNLRSLMELVGRITSAGAAAASSARPSVWAWSHVSGERARRQWAGLVPWVRWLTDRYPRALRDFPPCWYLHPDALEELSALWAAWMAAYHGDDEPREDLIAWHDRWLPGVTGRLLGAGGVLTACARAKQHRDVNLEGAPRNTFTPGDYPTVEEVAAGAAVPRSTVRPGL